MNISRKVFFSYHTDSSVNVVEDTAKMLESFELSCWYAKRDVHDAQNYARVIPFAIKGCALFVLLLNRYSIKSYQVEREINIAMNMNRPILIINTDGCPFDESSIVYVNAANSQMVYIVEPNPHILAQKICTTIVTFFKNGINFLDFEETNSARCKTSWDTNDLEFFSDEGERSRIDTQHQFVYNFAKDEYLKLLPDDTEFNFLDVGCNTGEQSKMFLENKPLKNYIGIDREAAALEQAKTAFPDGYMYVCDCEAEDFSHRLSEIENELGISGFDIINVSMMLLHTKNPAILIDVLSDHLSENGKIIILDIDDGFNVAFPDPDLAFERAVQLCFKTEYSGFRLCGREINKFLSDNELENITLHKIGLSTIGMSRKERESFFDIYFWFILDDLRKMVEETPDDKFIRIDFEWLKANYTEMKSRFKKRDFLFTLGFVLYSAEK